MEVRRRKRRSLGARLAYSVAAAWSVAACVIGVEARALAAQRVTGVVVDDVSRAPVVQALVALIDDLGVQRSTLLTDSAGGFAFVLQSGRYVLRVERLGYETYTSPVLVLEAAGTAVLEVRLGVGAVPLEPLLVSVRSTPPGRAAEFHERRNDPGRAGGFFLTREDIDRSPAARPTDLLVRIPSIVLIRTTPQGVSPQNAPEHYIVHLRGSTGASGQGSCGPAIYLDGVRIRQSENATVDWLLDPSQLEGVEVYSRASFAPAQYGAGNDCGVILFWTRAGEEGRDWNWKRVTVGLAGLSVFLGLLLLR